MENNKFTETTNQSWLSRLGHSFKGILIGIVLIIGSIVLLFWNEGRAVQTAKSLQEGANVVIPISAEMMNPNNNDKLIHLTALATTQDTVEDVQFGITENGIKLKRNVEMYQWEEKQESQTHEKLGGGTETVTTYHYSKTWSSNVFNSLEFKKPYDHQNPNYMPYGSKVYTANQVTVGKFTLSDGLLEQMNNFEPLSIDQLNEETIAKIKIDNLKMANGGYYIGNDPHAPEIGDMRITYEIIKPVVVSIIAKQNGTSFNPYIAKAGGKVNMLSIGNYSADDMFKQAEAENKMLTWILRVVGFIFMTMGFSLIFSPLSVLISVIPFLGNLVSIGTGIVAFAFSMAISLIVIGIGWIYYRPILGIILLIGATIPIIYTFRAAKKKQTAED